jgi:hypothetical protein
MDNVCGQPFAAGRDGGSETDFAVQLNSAFVLLIDI